MNLIIPVPHPDKMDKLLKSNKKKFSLRNKDKDNPARSMPKTS